MPKIEDFDQFKNLVNSLSNEAEWRANKGEVIEDIDPSDVVAAASPAQTDSSEPSAPDEFAQEQAGQPLNEDIFPDSESSNPSLAEEGGGDFDFPDDGNFDSDFNVADAFAGQEEPAGLNAGLGALDEPEMEDQSEAAADGSLNADLTSDPGLSDFDFNASSETGEGQEPPADEDAFHDLGDLPDLDAPMDFNADLPNASGASLPDLLGEESGGFEAADPQEAAASDLPELSSEPDFGGDDSGSEESYSSSEGGSEFSLNDFGDSFAEKSAPRPKARYNEDDEDDFDDEDESAEDLVFSDRQVSKIQAALALMPRNLRIALEEILASEQTGRGTISSITQKLLRRASARSLAEEVRKATGRTIIVPSFYEKNTGAAFERKQKGFAYTFSRYAWPQLRRALALIFLLWLTAILGFLFIYRPLKANSLYSRGYKTIVQANAEGSNADLQTQYGAGLELFRQGFEGWRLGPFQVAGWKMQSWFFKYAQAFIEQRQFEYAEQKYQELIYHYPSSRGGYLEYAAFESMARARYSEADAIYNKYLTAVRPNDYKALLGKGENLLEWAAVNPAKYAEAAQTYGLLLQTHKLQPDIIMGFIRYFVRTNNREQIELWTKFYEKRPRDRIDAATFVELAEWYIDNGRYEEAGQILERAAAADHNLPSLHYQFARYYGAIGSDAQELGALQQALYAITSNPASLSRKEVEMGIDIYRRLAHLNFKQNRYKEAEDLYLKAIARYEEALDRRAVSPRAYYGEIYKQLADLYYATTQDYSTVSAYLAKAVENLYDSADLRFKRGYIAYIQGQYANALSDFYRAYESMPENKNILFSLATAFMARGDYFAAQGSYEELRVILERERTDYANGNLIDSASIDTAALLEFLMKTYNNLGIALYNISLKSAASSQYRVQAEACISRALWYWDLLSRNPEARTRVLEQDLPGLNFKAVTYKTPGAALSLYNALPRNLSDEVSDWGY